MNNARKTTNEPQAGKGRSRRAQSKRDDWKEALVMKPHNGSPLSDSITRTCVTYTLSRTSKHKCSEHPHPKKWDKRYTQGMSMRRNGGPWVFATQQGVRHTVDQTTMKKGQQQRPMEENNATQERCHSFAARWNTYKKRRSRRQRGKEATASRHDETFYSTYESRSQGSKEKMPQLYSTMTPLPETKPQEIETSEKRSHNFAARWNFLQHCTRAEAKGSRERCHNWTARWNTRHQQPNYTIRGTEKQMCHRKEEQTRTPTPARDRMS